MADAAPVGSDVSAGTYRCTNDEARVLGPSIAATHLASDPRSGEVRETLDFIVRNDNRLPF
jgi:hypothetical protein